MKKTMKFDIAEAGATLTVAAPIVENTVPEAMKETDKALAAFEASAQEKSFAAAVLSAALSSTFRRDWLDGACVLKPEANPAEFGNAAEIHWLRLEEVGLQPDFAPPRQTAALETIMQSLHRPGRQRIVFAVSSNGAKIELRLGVQPMGDETGEAAKGAAELAGSFAKANWPGLVFASEKTGKKSEVSTRMAGFAKGSENHLGGREYAAQVRVVTGLPAVRKGAAGGQPVPAVTIDKLAASLPGRKWCYLVLAEPVSNKEVENALFSVRDAAGRAASLKSFQFGKSLNASFSESFSRNWGRSEGTSTPKIDWRSQGVRLGAIATAAVLCPGLLPALATGVIQKMGMPGLAMGVSYLFGKSSVGSDNSGQSYGEAVSESISASKGANISETIVSKHAEAISALLDAQAERYERAKALGAWDVGAYFIGQDAETADLGAAILKAVLSGDDSAQEPVRILSYQGDGIFENEKDPMDALLHFENPRVMLATPDGDEIPAHPLGKRFDDPRTLVGTRELCQMVNVPVSDLPGIPVRRIPADMGLADAGAVGEIPFGRQMFRGEILDTRPFGLSPSLLAKHALVCGINGSGKTNTILGILGSLLDDIGAPFLVLEPAKQEYVEWAIARNRALVKKCGSVAKARRRKDWINVYIPGRERWNGEPLEKLFLNPFDFVWLNKGEPPKTLEHIDRLKTVINAAMPMQEVLPVLMEELIYMAYGTPKAPRAAGEPMPCWLPKDASQRFPDFDEPVHIPSFQALSVQLKHLFATRTYAKDVQLNLRAALETRIDGFKRGWRKELLNKDCPRHSRADWEALFEHPTVVNLTSLTSDDDKAFFMAVLLLFVYEYRQELSETGDATNLSPKAGKLRHLLVVEEAHRVLGKAEPASSFSANPKQKVSELFSNMISEVRAYGQGILIADQVPCRLNEDAVKNTNLKIVHKLVSADDRSSMATALNLWEDQERAIGDLGVGEALVRGDMDKQACMVKVNKNVQ